MICTQVGRRRPCSCEAVVEHGHHQTTDDRADDGTDTAGDGRATDEDGGDGVELPAVAVLRAGGRATRATKIMPASAASTDMFIMTKKLTRADLDARELGGVRLPPTA